MENLVIHIIRLFCLSMLSYFLFYFFFSYSQHFPYITHENIITQFWYMLTVQIAQTVKFVGDPRRSTCDAPRVSVALAQRASHVENQSPTFRKAQLRAQTQFQFDGSTRCQWLLRFVVHFNFVNIVYNTRNICKLRSK